MQMLTFIKQMWISVEFIQKLFIRNQTISFIHLFINCFITLSTFIHSLYSFIISPIHSLLLLFIHSFTYTCVFVARNSKKEIDKRSNYTSFIYHDTSIATRNNYISPNHLFIHSPHFHPSLQEIALIYHSPARQLLIHSLTHISISA